MEIVDIKIGGDSDTRRTQIILPTGYDPSVTYRWVIENHGRTDFSQDFFKEDNPYYTQKRDHFTNKGWIIVFPFVGNSWGNDYAINRLKDTYDYVKANYNVEEKPLLTGQSMGGITSLNHFVRYPDRFIGLALLFPVSDLDANYYPKVNNSNFHSHINNAYLTTLENYEVDTAQHQPHNRFSDYASIGKKIKIWHGDADNVVNIRQSLDFQEGVNAVIPNLVELRTIKGTGHDTNSLTPYIAELSSFINNLYGETSQRFISKVNGSLYTMNPIVKKDGVLYKCDIVSKT